jgi:hypothetical protein
MSDRGGSQPGNIKKIEKRMYKFKELCAMYKVSPKTFRKMIRLTCRKAGKPIGHYYQIWQVQLIFKSLGIPGEWEIDNNFFDPYPADPPAGE